MSLEWVNGFAPDSQGRRVWSLAWVSLNVKLKGQGHEGQKRCALPSHPAAVEWNAFAANNINQQQMGPFHHCQGVILAACMQFMFGKTSLALVGFCSVDFTTG